MAAKDEECNSSTGTPNNNRKRLVGIAEAAFSRYILEQTGMASADYKPALVGNGTAGLIGWRWVFPEAGAFTRFPDQSKLWSWPCDDLLYALHSLLMKTLRLERVPVEELQEEARALQQVPLAVSQSQTESPRPDAIPASNRSQPVRTNSNQSGTGANQFAELLANDNANQNTSSSAPMPNGLHHFDDLVAQVNTRSKQWKNDWRELQKCKSSERALQRTTSEQASRIGTLEKALRETGRLGSPHNDASGFVEMARAPDILAGAMNDMEAFYRGEISQLKAQNEALQMEAGVLVGLGDAVYSVKAFYKRELAELKEQNEELQEIIKNQEQDVQNAVYLQERNRVLEQQLAEKTAESASALAGATAVSKSGRLLAKGQAGPGNSYPTPPTRMSQPSYEVKCDRCRSNHQVCRNPGRPCDRCKQAGSICTFALPGPLSSTNDVPDYITKARQAVTSAKIFLASRSQSASPYYNTPQGLRQPQQSIQHVPEGYRSPVPPANSPYPPPMVNMHGASSSTPMSMNGSIKRTATEASASASKRTALNSYKSPYVGPYGT